MLNQAQNYPTFIGERIKIARTERGLSQEELSKLVNIQRPAISQIESGKRAVDSVELLRIAKTLNKPLTYFLEEEIQEEKQFSILFRADEISQKDRSTVEKFHDLCLKYSELENILNLKNDFTIPRWNSAALTKEAAINEGESAARNIRSVLSLGGDPILNLASLLENYGIKIWQQPLLDSKAWGFSISSQELGWCIFVNTNCSIARQNFTIAHEFGHLIMDHKHDVSIFSESSSSEFNKSLKNVKETRANAFAAAFLMPEESIKEVLRKYHIATSKDVSSYVIDFLRQYYQVSYESMCWRLLGLDIITKQQKIFLIEARPNLSDAQQQRVYEVLPIRYKTLALEAYRNTKISIGKLAEYLMTDIYKTRQILKDLSIIQLGS